MRVSIENKVIYYFRILPSIKEKFRYNIFNSYIYRLLQNSNIKCKPGKLISVNVNFLPSDLWPLSLSRNLNLTIFFFSFFFFFFSFFFSFRGFQVFASEIKF